MRLLLHTLARLVGVLALWFVIEATLSALSGPAIGADIGLGLAIFFCFATAVGGWAAVDALGSGPPAILPWLVAVPLWGIPVAAGSGPLAQELPFFIGLAGVPAAAGFGFGLLLRSLGLRLSDLRPSSGRFGSTRAPSSTP